MIGKQVKYTTNLANATESNLEFVGLKAYQLNLIAQNNIFTFSIFK